MFREGGAEVRSRNALVPIQSIGWANNLARRFCLDCLRNSSLARSFACSFACSLTRSLAQSIDARALGIWRMARLDSSLARARRFYTVAKLVFSARSLRAQLAPGASGRLGMRPAGCNGASGARCADRNPLGCATTCRPLELAGTRSNEPIWADGGECARSRPERQRAGRSPRIVQAGFNRQHFWKRQCQPMTALIKITPLSASRQLLSLWQLPPQNAN